MNILSPAVRHSSGSHASENESYEAFNSRYQTFFTQVEDVFELQRGLNNCFAYDLVPATEVVEAALRASRKVNDYATAVRILEGVKEKVENKLQYQAYLDELKPVIQELGECLKRKELQLRHFMTVRTPRTWLTHVIVLRCQHQGRALQPLNNDRPTDRIKWVACS